MLGYVVIGRVSASTSAGRLRRVDSRQSFPLSGEKVDVGANERNVGFRPDLDMMPIAFDPQGGEYRARH